MGAFNSLFDRAPLNGAAPKPAVDIASAPEPLIERPAEGEPWPLDALGDTLADAAKTIRDTAQCPDGLAGPSVLTAATLAVQGHVDMQHPVGHAAPCSTTLVTLGESGERKSTVDKMAMDAFFEAAAEGEKAYRKEYAEHRALLEARDAVRSRIKQKQKVDTRTSCDIADELASLGADPFPPIPPKRIVTDPNFEGLIKWMGTAHGSVAWISNEAGQSIGGTAFADENRLKFGAGLSIMWDGQPTERVRAGDGHHSLLGRRVTCHLMLQGEIARPFLADPLLRAQGWLSRALICEPASRIGSRPWREPKNIKTALASYRSKLRRFIDLPPPLADDEGPPNVLKPRPVPWTPEAKANWIQFHDEIEAALGAGGVMADHRGFGAKCAENAGRIATVLAAFADKRVVDAGDMANAIVIVGHYVDETLRHRAAAVVHVDFAVAEKVRIWLTQWPNPTVTVRDIMRLGPNPAREQKAARRSVGILREYGWLAGSEAGPWEIRGRA